MEHNIKELRRKFAAFISEHFKTKFAFRLAYLNKDKLDAAELMVMGPLIRKQAEKIGIDIELEQEGGIIICKGKGKKKEIEQFLSYLWEDVGLVIII